MSKTTMAGYPKSHLSIALVVGIALLLAMTAVPDGDSETTEQLPVSLSLVETTAAPEAAPATATTAEALQTVQNTVATQPVKTFEVKRGDSLATIFNRAGLSPRELHNVISLGPETAVLGKIIPGQKIHIETTEAGELHQLEYEVNRLKSLWVKKEQGVLTANWSELEPEVLLNYKTATITADNPSVYEAGQEAGLSDNLIMNLSYVFQWDISFALDLRQATLYCVWDAYVEVKFARAIFSRRFTTLAKPTLLYATRKMTGLATTRLRVAAYVKPF
ncbi:MAG: LysM-like peptidoglycan-binding domain-containing protein [Pseudomonadales bacterium]